MKRLPIALALMAASLTACVDSSVVLFVRPDGSGRAVITSRLYEAGLRAFDSLFPGGGTPSAIEDELPPPNPSELNRQFGARVRLIDTKLEKTTGGVTRTTSVSFDDVASLRMMFPPVLAIPAGSSVSVYGVGTEPVITFAMKPHDNGDRLLLVRLPDDPVNAEGNPDPEMTVFKTNSPEERAFKQAVRNMALRLFVEIEGPPLLRTNAPANTASRATILDLDLERLITNLDEAKVRRAMMPGSLQEVLWQVGDMPGAVLPTEHEVFLEFEAPQQAQPPAAAAAPPAAQAPPDTEIYLAPLKSANGTIAVGTPINITNSPGYDNQPSFTPDGKSILFTSARGSSPAPAGGRGGAAAQTDIYRYDITSRAISRVTETPESEYSPTMMPGGRRISVVRVEPDGTQRLWSVAAAGPTTQLELVLPAVKPVGYHAWADDHTLALFVLGQPATLQLADLTAGTVRTIASDIGRSLQPIPGAGSPRAISFVQRERQGDATRLIVKKLDPVTGAATDLTPAVEGSREADVAWMRDGTLLMAHEGRLYAWKAGQQDWREVANLERLSLSGITRLAVSPGGDFLALVGSPR